MNAETLVQKFRNYLAYDFDLPQDSPGSQITDAEVLAYLSSAQDKLARLCRMYSPNITFSLTAGSTWSFDNSGFSKRLCEVIDLYLSDGSRPQKIAPSQHNPYSNEFGSTYWFWTGDSLSIYPASSSTVAGTIQGTYLPPVLALGQPSVNCGLPEEIVFPHLPAYAVAINAAAFAPEPQQINRLSIMQAQAEEACRTYSTRTVGGRTTFKGRVNAYRV